MTVEKLITDHIDIWSSALQTRSTAGRGSNGKIDLYGIKKLRELILELAVRGKLVPQDPNDGPASELLKRIAAEKAELVKQGKIKKQKPLPLVSEVDKPFDLPNGWEIEFLGNLAFYITKGTTPTSVGLQFTDEGVNFVKVEDISNNSISRSKNSQFISDESNHILARSQLDIGDILFSIAGTIGKTCLVTAEDLPANTNQALAIIKGTATVYEAKFLLALLNSFVSNKTKEKARGGAMPNVSLGDLSHLILVIPPMQEQIRIIEKLNKLMFLCDQLEQQSLTSLDAHQQLVETLLATLTDSQNAEELAENWARISQHFDTLFTTEASIDALKQTILQLAVMGKLVSQDPNDEPASELLKRIEQEKAQQIKEGKIKKQKPLPSVSDDEKPFELPQGWEWCRIAELGICSTGKTPSTSNSSYYSGKIPFLGPGDITPDGCISIGEKFVSVDGAEKSTIAYKNDILTVCIGGSIGKSGIVKELVVFNQQINCISPIIVRPDYIFYSFNTGAFLEKLISEATGSATPIINRGRWEMLLISLPPEKEMVRIINKVKQLLVTCDLIKSRLQLAQQIQLHLADALTDAALN